eukprot:COSAG03_NODE_519_length_7216_cov_23.238724_6_plen_329_part_00
MYCTCDFHSMHLTVHTYIHLFFRGLMGARYVSGALAPPALLQRDRIQPVWCSCCALTARRTGSESSESPGSRRLAEYMYTPTHAVYSTREDPKEMRQRSRFVVGIAALASIGCATSQPCEGQDHHCPHGEDCVGGGQPSRHPASQDVCSAGKKCPGPPYVGTCPFDCFKISISTGFCIPHHPPPPPFRPPPPPPPPPAPPYTPGDGRASGCANGENAVGCHGIEGGKKGLEALFEGKGLGEILEAVLKGAIPGLGIVFCICKGVRNQRQGGQLETARLAEQSLRYKQYCEERAAGQTRNGDGASSAARAVGESTAAMCFLCVLPYRII